MTTAGRSCPNKKGDQDMDLPPAQAQYLSAEDDLVHSSISISSTPLQKTVAGDSALRFMLEENAFQTLSDSYGPKSPRLSLCDDSSPEDSDFLFLTFPKKLWKIVESERFKSLWWDEDGTCVVIDEELFKKEVLERKGLLRIFETDCMKSFIRQLNLYGFTKLRQNFQRSASLVEFFAEEKAAAAFNKLQFYHNPNFKKGYPHLLSRCKRRIGIKNTPPIAFSLEDFHKSCLKSRPQSPGGQATFGHASRESDLHTVASPREKMHKSGLPKPATNKGLASAVIRMRSRYSSSPAPLRASEHRAAEDKEAQNDQLAPFHVPQHVSHAGVNPHEIDSTTTTSVNTLYHALPPVPNTSFAPVKGMPAFPTMYPDLAMQAHWASLFPYYNPWFPMPMIAAASAVSMSRSSHHHQNPSYRHCPNCNYTWNVAEPTVTENMGNDQ